LYRGTITPDARLPPDERPRLGFLYPRGGSAYEYYQFAEHFSDNIRCYLIGGMHAYGGAKTHYEGPLFQMGAIENLSYPARSMKPLAVHAAIWCSTSASFIGGRRWSLDQAAGLTEIIGAPCSNTALAFVDAVHALGVGRVSLLASYPQDVTLAFKRFLAEADIEVCDFIHLDADAGEDAYNFTQDFLAAKAREVDMRRAQALLVPDTAMAAFPLMRQLEATLELPVLTANQVSIWKAAELAGTRLVTGRSGRLFASA
jgi:maleate cis-trans isomerase